MPGPNFPRNRVLAHSDCSTVHQGTGPLKALAFAEQVHQRNRSSIGDQHIPGDMKSCSNKGIVAS